MSRRSLSNDGSLKVSYDIEGISLFLTLWKEFNYNYTVVRSRGDGVNVTYIRNENRGISIYLEIYGGVCYV